MKYMRAFGLFWWDFVVGDDWRMAVGVVLLLVTTFVLSHRGISSWWFPPIAVLAVLGYSLHRAVNRR